METADHTVHRFASLDGTNAEALRRGAPPGEVFLAEFQTAGRGRAGRIWKSPPGNLHMTICSATPCGRNPAHLSFVAALAVREVLAAAAPGVAFSLKWPNDVLCDGRKIAGILIEAGRKGYAIGIGVNLAESPPDDEVRMPATNLRTAAGVDVAPDALAVRACARFGAWHARWAEAGFPPLREAWLASAHGMGDTIAASTAAGTLAGVFVGLDEDGALLVDDADGTRHAIAAGDVVFSGAQ